MKTLADFKRALSTHAETAKLIRGELKKAFPTIKFSVRADSFAGGDAVRIDWKDGPTYTQVQKLVNKYQYGHFNAMEDIYENTNSRSDIPQVKYVQVSREISNEIMDEVFLKFKRTHVGWENLTSRDQSSSEFLSKWGHWTASEFIRRYLFKLDLTNGYQPKDE